MTAGCPNRQPRGTLQARRQRPSPDTTLLGLYFQQPARRSWWSVLRLPGRVLVASAIEWPPWLGLEPATDWDRWQARLFYHSFAGMANTFVRIDDRLFVSIASPRTINGHVIC